MTPLPKNDPTNLEENMTEIFAPNYIKKFFTISGQVNYVVESVPTHHFFHEDTPKFHLLSIFKSFFLTTFLLGSLLTNTILHKEIREKGGAYGSGCKFNSNGLLSFYSYRDPRNFETYDAFLKAVKWADNNKFTYIFLASW